LTLGQALGATLIGVLTDVTTPLVAFTAAAGIAATSAIPALRPPRPHQQLPATISSACASPSPRWGPDLLTEETDQSKMVSAPAGQTARSRPPRNRPGPILDDSDRLEWNTLNSVYVGSGDTISSTESQR
ncbi:MAG: hypothetical protein ABI251_02250, partial [Mycobacteriaceae bacterium]